eukprot:TRINITY_DN20722_c0_g3_i1.p1 TRINITY_DN20722_c0_g3~~TRINITY_DN20722_c0_g3_i1.p1  ORF type:complete len:318 (+),score=57.41 TRINITY_DN20722_c0_g3_i1:177-1130(+)
MSRIVSRLGRRYASGQGTPGSGEDMKTDESGPEGKVLVKPVRGIELKQGPKFTAVYGEKGYVEDTVDRIEESAKEIRSQYVNDAPDANIKPLGRGPKPWWSYLDASPRGWWPMGEMTIGVPPDADGRPALPSNTLKCPAKIAVRGKSSTERAKESRDVWLAEMGTHRRLALAISRRLTTRESERLKTFSIIMGVLLFLTVLLTAKQLYILYTRYQFIQNAAFSEDFKLSLMVRQVSNVETVRGMEFINWLGELWSTYPVPPDLEAEYELVWRECIKKGWIKLDKDEEWLIAEPFTMKYIPPKGADIGEKLGNLGPQL